MKDISRLIKQHEDWRSRCIPLIASENVTSPAVDSAVVSDLNHRYAEGLPGKRHYPGCRFIDEIEVEAQERMKRLFGVNYVDLRPLSGTQANLILYTAFTHPGDTIMRLATGMGGHISGGSRRLGGTAGSVRRLDCATFAFDEETFNIDVDESLKIYRGLGRVGKKPKILLFGASVYLFPHPIEEIANEIGFETVIAHDISHVGGLVAGGQFWKIPRVACDVITMSTHKTFFGPQHGVIMAQNPELFKKIQRATFPANVSNHHLGNMAGVGIAAEEHLKSGANYAAQVVSNAKVLAQSLCELGYNVIGEKYGFTESHQVLVDLSDLGAAKIEKKLEDVGILANKNLLPWDRRFGRTVWNPGGLRIGVQEVTRLGMESDQMKAIALFIDRAIQVPRYSYMLVMKIKEFMSHYQGVGYCDI